VNTRNHRMCDEESTHKVVKTTKSGIQRVPNNFKVLVKEAEPQYEKLTTVELEYINHYLI
jgi:hypothetical protein